MAILAVRWNANRLRIRESGIFGVGVTTGTGSEGTCSGSTVVRGAWIWDRVAACRCFQDAVDMQCGVYKDVGIAVTCRVDVRMTATGCTDGC